MKRTYICRVFTPGFWMRLDNHIREELKQYNGTALQKRIHEWRIRSSFYMMYNRPEEFPDEVKSYYMSLGLWSPDYVEVELEAKEVGVFATPRIEWEGKIRKIDDIAEIFFYRDGVRASQHMLQQKSSLN